MNDDVLARMMGVDEKTANEMRTEWEALDIEWHCPGRHGVVRNVPSAKAGRVNRVIEWHLGHGAARWTSPERGLRSAEFVHMTKTSPPPRKPWEWCGETVLFEDWRQQEIDTRERARTFLAASPVWFEHKGVRYEGFVTKVNQKTVSVMVPNDGVWRIPPTQLHEV